MSKSLDMQLHWLRDKTQHKHFNIIWEKGKVNAADYFTKVTHPMVHHKIMRPNYVLDQLPNHTSTPSLNIMPALLSHNCKGVLVLDTPVTWIQLWDMYDVSMMSQQ